MSANITYKNLLPPTYVGPAIVFIAGETSTNFSEPALVNGYTAPTDFCSLPAYAAYKPYKPSYLTFLYIEEQLYATNKFYLPSTELSTPALETLTVETLREWEQGIGKEYEQEPVLIKGGEEAYLEAWHKDQKVIVEVWPVQPPKGKYWLGSIFDTPEKQVMYEEFLADPVINFRINKFLDVHKIPVDSSIDRTLTQALPIHSKDKETNELVISDNVLSFFSQYQFAQNYIRGFEPTTAEFVWGKVMMLYPKFCEFMLSCARDLENDIKIHNLEENMQNELKKAFKYIEKNKDLLYMYNNWEEIYKEKVK